MFKGVSTLAEFEECLKRGLCEDHLKEITENELEEMKDEFPWKAFRYVRINVLYPFLFKKAPKCEKMKLLMEKTAMAKIFLGGDISEAVDFIFIVDSVIIFTLCQLAKICCIGELFHALKISNSEDPNKKPIQDLILGRLEHANVNYFNPILLKNFAGCDASIVKTAHCITLFFIRRFCNKPSIKIAIETIQNDIMDDTGWEDATAVANNYFNEKKYTEAINIYNPFLMQYFYSWPVYMKVGNCYLSMHKCKIASVYYYLALCIDRTCTQAYCVLITALAKLKLYDEAIEVVNYGLEHAKKDDFYGIIKKYSDALKSEDNSVYTEVNCISENAINHSVTTEKNASDENEKLTVDLVDSDSADSDSEDNKEFSEKADSQDSLNVQSNDNKDLNKEALPELVYAADSDDESEPPVTDVDTMEKKPSSANEAKEKTKNKSTGATKKKRTISEGSMDIQPEEEMDTSKIYSYLKEASEALLAECGYKAVQIFRGPLRSFIESSKFVSFEECDIVCIKYSYGIAYCKSGGYDDLQKCINILEDILKNHDSIPFPAAHYSLGLAYRKLNRFKEALKYLEVVQNFLCKGIHSKVYPWPGMTTVIQETKPDILKTLVQDLIKECENPPNPDALCRYANCTFQRTIYYTDPDFKGYISLFCSDQCNMQYHLQCWKAMKEEKNLNDKEFLEKTCFTPDCEGAIVKIQNIDKKGDLGKEFISDLKKTAKQKWAKWEKKPDVKEKKKKRGNLKSEDSNQDIPNDCERVSSRKNSSVGSESPFPQIIGLNGSVEEITSKSEIIQKSLYEVKVKAELPVNSSSENICRSSDIPMQEKCDISPEDIKAFSKNENVSGFLLDECIKNNVYSFMAEFLNIHGPLKIDDPLLINEMASFPTEVHKIIADKGGIGGFLKDDLRFAVVGDLYVCVVSDLATAYRMFSSSSLPNDFRSLQSLESPEHLKYYNENRNDNRYRSFGLNPDAVEYTPVVSSCNKSNNFNSLPQHLNCNSSYIPAVFEPASKCANHLNTGTHLNTYLEAQTSVNKSKSCETVINSKIQTNSESSIVSGQADKTAGRMSDECIYKSKLSSEAAPDSLHQKFSSKNNSFSINSEDSSVSNAAANFVNESTSSRHSKLEAQLLPLLNQYYSEEMKDYRQSINSSIKPYVIKKLTESTSLGIMTDLKCLEKSKDVETTTIRDQENIIDDLKSEVHDLSKQNSSLQNVLEYTTEQQQKLASEVARLKKNLNDSTAKLEIMKKEFDKKEQDLLGQKKHLTECLKDSNESVEKLKKNVTSLTNERNNLQKNVENLTTSIKKLEEKMKNALDIQEKKFNTTIQTLQKENTELKSKTKYAELQVLHMKKAEYLRRIEDKSLEAVEKRKEINSSMTMMPCVNPVVQNCMKMISTHLITYVNNLSTLKLDFVRKIDEQIMKVENGASLKDLKEIEMKELPAVPSWKSTYPNGPLADKSPFNSMASSFNFGFNAGVSPQMPSTVIAPSVTLPGTVIPSAASLASSKVLPSVNPAATAISPPTASVVSSVASSSIMSMSNVPPVREPIKNNKMDISSDLDFTSLNPTIQESFKSAMASINSFASSPYSAPSLDDEFDKKCVVFKHPDTVPESKPEPPKVPPGLMNSVSHSSSVRAPSINSIPEIAAEAVSANSEKSYGCLDTVPKVKIEPTQSAWDLEKKKTIGTGNKSSYEKLLAKLTEQFPTYTQEELMYFVKEFRTQRQGKLSGLPMDTVISQISAIIKSKKKEPKVLPKPTKVLVNKKLVPDPKPPTVNEQQAAKKKTAWNIDIDSKRTFSGNADDDCTICCDLMTSTSAYKVSCGHTFHEDCIRQWLGTNSTCPVCRILLLLPDEYPSLT